MTDIKYKLKRLNQKFLQEGERLTRLQFDRALGRLPTMQEMQQHANVVWANCFARYFYKQVEMFQIRVNFETFEVEFKLNDNFPTELEANENKKQKPK